MATPTHCCGGVRVDHEGREIRCPREDDTTKDANVGVNYNLFKLISGVVVFAFFPPSGQISTVMFEPLLEGSNHTQ